jgi:hypothetical protein
VPLSCGLEHDDGSGGGNVQRGDGSGHGDAKEVVAGTADELVQAAALAPENDYSVGREIVVVVIGYAALVESDAPDVVLFELLEGADEVDDAGDTDVLGGSRGGFDGDGAEGGSAAFGEDDAVDSGSVGGAEERAEVLGVFDAVEGEQKAGFGTCAEVFEVEELASAGDGDDSLMVGGFGQAGELFFRLETEADAGFAAGVDDLLQALVVSVKAFPGDTDVVEFSAAGAQSLLDRVQAVQNVHLGSLSGIARPDACK